jgi:hypothetical protein
VARHGESSARARENDEEKEKRRGGIKALAALEQRRFRKLSAGGAA